MTDRKIIGSKLPPKTVPKTFFSSGRAAFAYLIGEVVKPKRVYLPTYMCWSLVSTMLNRFPEIEVRYYPVFRDLRCEYPEGGLDAGDALVVVHYFGHENRSMFPWSRWGQEYTILEDTSHSHFSVFPHIDYAHRHAFGSFRKILKVADGGYIDRKFYNVLYQPTRKLDTWLRYEAKDWRDVREAENMIDRGWGISDMSAQSLALVMLADENHVRLRRKCNEWALWSRLRVGMSMFEYREHECPLTHNRLFETTEERDDLRAFLMDEDIYCSIHWPLHEAIKRYGEQGGDIGDAQWLADHILCIPVAHEYGPEDMARIVTAAERWAGK